MWAYSEIMHGFDVFDVFDGSIVVLRLSTEVVEI